MLNSSKMILSVLILVTGLATLGSCKEIKNTKNNIEKELLIGSWLDLSGSALHFSMLKDGTAHSDNMKTLLYKKWRLEENKLILTVKSIGNGTSSIGEDVYEIKVLTEKKMILLNGEYLLNFEKKQ